MKKALLILFAAAALGAYGATMATKDYVDRSVNNLYTNVVDQVSNLFSTIDTDNFLPRSWTNNQDVVIGQGHSWIDGSWATAVGNNNAAMGTNATAIGSSSIARGTYATAVGTADALADYSIALGLNAQVLGRMSFAGGPYARAHGEYGSSVGYNSLSSNMFSVAIGPWAFAEGQQSVALGTYASAHSMDSVAIGAGAKSGDRNSATNFNAGCVSVAIGYQTEATNSGAVAIGPRWVRSGFFSQTLTGASAGSPYSIAIGGSVTTGAQNSVSIGSRAMASNNFAVVISASTNLDVNATVHHSHGDGTITFGVDGGLGDVYVGDRPLSDIIMNDGVVRRAEVYGTPTRWIDASGCVWEVSFSLSPWSFSGAGVANYSNLSVMTNEDFYVLLDNGGFVDYGSEFGFDLLDVHFANAAVVATRSIVPSSTNIVGHIALTDDVPEWPIQLVTTNTPLIFVDGEDTNVISVALMAQPNNYASLSFLNPVSYYLPNRFSLLELGNDYQIAASQWFQVGRYLYAQNPENIVFVGGGQHRSLQDYLDACSPQTMADLLSCYIPTNGGGRIHGDLTIDGRLTAGELITITNSDIHAKGFQVVNKVLTAEGLTASNGMVQINCARMLIGMGTPRIHLETNSPSAITYGGTWEHPEGSVFSWQEQHIAEYLAGDISQQDIELRNPYMRYMDVKDQFVGWKIKGHSVNNGQLKHFTLDNYRTYHFTDSDVGDYGIEFTISSNAHVRIVYDFASTPPSAVYFDCMRVDNDASATMLSNGTELLAPTAGVKTLLEIEHLSDWTFMVKETPLTHSNTVMPWAQSQEEPEP